MSKELEPSGNMTNNMQDVIFLGKQMERLRNEQQLEEDKRIPDPVQFDEDDAGNSSKQLKSKRLRKN